jgi:hypothetical protein
VPATPEILGIGGKIRVVEIDHQINAHQFRESSCNIRVSGEVAVNLNSKKNSPGDNIDKTYPSGAPKNLVDDRRDPIRDGNLLKEAQND